METKLIIFDFGGTIDTNGVHWSEVFWNFYRKYGIGINRDVYDYIYVSAQKQLDAGTGLENKTLYETILAQITLQSFSYYDKIGTKLLSDSQLINMVDEIYAFVKSTVKNAISTIEALSRKAELAILSNFNGNLKIVCDELGLSPYFDYLIDSAIVKLWKPDTKIFEYCLNISGIAAANAIMIGDSYSRDITPAKKLGIKTIWLNNQSWEKPEDTCNADLIINSFDKLNEIFKI